MERKKKILLIQSLLLVTGIILIFLTYNPIKNSSNIISEEAKSEINKKLENNKNTEDAFFNIEYSGLDLAGNRYILKAKEATNNESNSTVVNLKFIDAVFYFKNGSILNVTSDSGLYNNKTLDMSFEKNVVGKYEGSELFAEKAEYSNSKGYLIISDNVKVKDIKGSLMAEKLVFDIKKNKLNISSSGNKKINTVLNN